MKLDDEERPLLGTRLERPGEDAIGINAYGSETRTEKVPFLKSFRKYIILLLLAAMTVTSSTPASMSSALVCIVPLDDNNTKQPANHSTKPSDSEWKFYWDKQSQGWVLSSFFIGYVLSQFPAGLAVTKWGPKRVLTVGLLFISIFQVLVVPAAYYGLGYLYTDRGITGLIAGCLFAPTYALLGRWAPKSEASLLFAVVGSGLEFGIMVAFVTSTFACQIPFQGGWPFIFYILGGMALLTTFAVAIFVSDSPFNNRFISKKEVRFMSGTVPKLECNKGGLSSVPVKSILKSRPVWAIIVSEFGCYWFYYMYVNVAPLYLKEVLKFSDAQTTLLSGLPFAFSMFIIFPSGYVSDMLVNKGILSNTAVRKINDGISKIIPAGVLVGMAYLPEGASTLTFFLNTVLAVTSALCYVSWMSNPIDLAPAYAGYLVGLCEGATLWIAVAIPIVVETMTQNKKRSEWQLAFFITAGVQVVTFVFYAIFASGELQPWALSTYDYSLKNDDDDDEGEGEGEADDDEEANDSGGGVKPNSPAAAAAAAGDSGHSDSASSRMSPLSFSNTNRSQWSVLVGTRARSATLHISHGANHATAAGHVRPRRLTESDVTSPWPRAMDCNK